MTRYALFLTTLLLPHEGFAWSLWRTTVLDERVQLGSAVMQEYRFKVSDRAYYDVVLEVDRKVIANQLSGAVDLNAGVPFFAFEILAEDSEALCPSGAQYLLEQLARESNRRTVRFVERRSFMNKGWYRLRFIALGNLTPLGAKAIAGLWIKESHDQSYRGPRDADPNNDEANYQSRTYGVVRESPPYLSTLDSMLTDPVLRPGSDSPALRKVFEQYQAAMDEMRRRTP